MAEVYPSLQRIAGSRLAGAGDVTLDATELVHEAYLRLGEQRSEWRSREQFFAIAARVMRRIVIDHLRRRERVKRGGGQQKVALHTGILVGEPFDLDLMALDDALSELAAVDESAVRVVEMRFFSGMKTEEIASSLRTSPSTVERRWRFARAWLERRLIA